MQRAKLIIEGKVQGVFYRKFVKEHADKMNIHGWVKNVKDHVEAMLEGEDIQPLIELCKEGPKGCKVTDFKIIHENNKAQFQDFTIK